MTATVIGTSWDCTAANSLCFRQKSEQSSTYGGEWRKKHECCRALLVSKSTVFAYASRPLVDVRHAGSHFTASCGQIIA